MSMLKYQGLILKMWNALAVKDRIKKCAKVVEDYELQQEDRQIELRMYKVRWIWYHTILGIELAAVFVVLVGIYLKL